MPRFFFHQRIGEQLIEDLEGAEHDGADGARASAVKSARHLWAAAILAGSDLSGESIEIVDEEGFPVATIALDAGLPFSLKARAERQSAGDDRVQADAA